MTHRDALTAASTPDDVIHLLTEEALAELAAYSDDELAFDLARARRIHGAATTADTLRAAIRGRRKSAPPPLHEQHRPDGLRGWLASHGCPHLPDGDAHVNGYALTPIGAITTSAKQPEMVSLAPIAIVGRAADPETDRVAVVVVWCYHGKWARRVLDRGVAVTRDGVLALAAEGAPVDQSNATGIAKWLQACDLALDTPTGACMSRMGWLPDGSGFAWGATPLGAAVSVIAPGAGEREELARYQTGGTLEGWVTGVWNRCAGYPAEVAILASLATPLLHVVGSTGFTLDIGGPRGTGKTTSQHAAGSVWGAGLLVPWPKTWAGMRGTVEFRADIPAILDDTKHASSWAQVQDLLYQVAGERSQVLGSAGGGTRAGRMVRTIVISTGESPIAEHLQDAQGAAFRILTIGRAPIPSGLRNLVTRCEESAREHYGHAGPAVVRYLLERRAEWPTLRARWRELSDRIAEAHPGDDAGRLAPRIALIYLAAEVAEAAIGIRSSDDVLRAFERHALGGVQDRDAPAEALRHALGWLESRPSQVVGWQREHLQEPLLGVAEGQPGVAFVSVQLSDILERGGYDPVEIRRQWAERGWLVKMSAGRDGRARTDTRISVLGRQMRVVLVSQAAIAALDAAP